MLVTNIKPQNQSVINTVPNNRSVTNIIPNNQSVNTPTQIYLETRTINKGEPMGLLLALTYPNTFTFQAVRF